MPSHSDLICDRPGCDEPATFHFGVEAPEDDRLKPQAYAQGEIIAGLRRYPGDTVHVCPEHARQVYDQCKDAEIVRMLRGQQP